MKLLFEQKIINDETGEILEDQQQELDVEQQVKTLINKDAFRRGKKEQQTINSMLGDHVMTFQPAIAKAGRELGPMENKILNCLLGVMDYDNYISIPYAELASDAKVSRHTAMRAVKKLVAEKYLTTTKKGRENYFRLNPNVAWKGQRKTQLQLLQGGKKDTE